MAPAPNPSDIIFLRNTGFTLIFATVVAGAITLSLTFRESQFQMAQDVQRNSPVQIVAASFEGSLATEQ